ncbi:hypothetical protein ABZ721_14420 [Streptomyces sp. NPDC006733]|uniref:hypothetical protein n=1 Tax=Streptomyces sp. NPDC006733 TaxID=3155460 RepID=UPI00340CAB73
MHEGLDDITATSAVGALMEVRDGRRQVTIALTPDFRGDPDDAVDALLNKVFCD